MAVHDVWKTSLAGTELRHRFVTLDWAANGHDWAHPELLASRESVNASCDDEEVELTYRQRVSDAFLGAVCRYADSPALVLGPRTIRYAELGQWSLAVAYHLLEEPGFRTGDRVALMLENGPEFIAAYYGVLAAGGVVVPLPVNIEWCRLERIAHICGINRILARRQLVARRPEVDLDDCASIDLRASVPFSIPRIDPLRIDGQSLAMIMFTSGSSGEPKGVMLSDGNILANSRSILQYLPIQGDDRALALLPFYHAFGHSILQTHLLIGATLVIDGNMMFPSTILDALERHGATSFSAVPEGYHSLLAFGELGHRPLPHLRYMSVAGGALKPEAVVAVAQRIAPADFYVMYGQTEATARLAYLPAPLAQVRPDSIGRAIPEVDLRVLSPDGNEVVDGETGELCAGGQRNAGILERSSGDRCGAQPRVVAHRRPGGARRGGVFLRPGSQERSGQSAGIPGASTGD